MDPVKSTIRFAVVGCGHIGKRHAEMIVRNPESELAALIDPKPSRVLDIERFDIPVFKSLEEFLQHGPEADVVTVATPNGYHASQALHCLHKGKHVVIEKPMALNKKDAQQIINKASEVQKHVFTVMQNRYSPPSRWINDLTRSGKLGKIYFVQLNCYWNRDHRYYTKDGWHGSKDLDGGTLFTQFSHFIDMLYWLFGDIRPTFSRFWDFNHTDLTDFEDSGTVGFDLLNGGAGCLNYSTSIWDKNLESSMTIIAEFGSIKIGGQYMNEVEYCHIKDYTMPALQVTNPGNDYGFYTGSAQNHHFVIKNVVDVLKGRAEITTKAADGLAVVDIIERIYQSKSR